MAENEDATRHIPEDVKRSVRQRCHFGCVKCGLPVYHYDHIEEFSKVKQHVAANITLLCPNHHHEKTVGRLPIETVRRWDSNPINRTSAQTASHLMNFAGSEAAVVLGNNVYSYDFRSWSGGFAALQFSGETIIGFERDGQDLLLNLTLRDVLRNIILHIQRSEIRFTTNIEDFKYVGRRMTIKPRFSGPLIISQRDNELTIERGTFYGPSATLLIDKDAVTVSPMNIRFTNAHGRNAAVGLSL